MGQGVEDIWPEVIQEANAISPYYLLLGRVPGREGEVKVKLKMPSSSFFSCFDEQKKSYFESVHSSRVGNMSDLLEKLMKPMKKLTIEIDKLQACCVENVKSETCLLCPKDILEFRGFLESNGFISAPLSSITYSENVQQNGVVQSLFEISATLPDGTTLDINQDVETYLNAISTKVEGIEGNIAHYDPANINCTDVLEWVNGIPPLALQGNPNTRTKSKTSKSSQARFLLKMDVITTEDAGGNVEVHMRSSEDLGDLPECEVGTIFLINVDAPELDMSEVRHYLDTFWKVLLVDSTNNLTPFVLDLDYLSISQLRDLDAISVIGNDECKIYEYIKDNYGRYDPFNFLTRVLSWANSDNELNIEKGDAGIGNSEETPYLSVVSTSRVTNEIVYDFACKSKEEAIGFVVFHANGHNAGIVHCGPESCVKGFMSSGSCIMRHLKNNGNYLCFLEGLYNEWYMGNPYDNLYQVIINKTEAQDYSRIKNRFIK